MTVPEAAAALGVSQDAIRARVKRRTLPVERAGGRVYVLLEEPLDGDQGGAKDGDQGTVQQSDLGMAHALLDELRDRVRYLERQVEEERESRRRADTIIAQLSAANAEQARTIRAIEAPREPSREPSEAQEPSEMDQGTLRVRHGGRDEPFTREESEAPQEPSETSETAESPGPRERRFTDEERAQEAAQPRPWWRRMFGA